MKRGEVKLLFFLAAAALAEWPLVRHFRPDVPLLFALPFAKVAVAVVIGFLILSSNHFRQQSEPPAFSTWGIAGLILAASVFMDLFFLGQAFADCER